MMAPEPPDVRAVRSVAQQLRVHTGQVVLEEQPRAMLQKRGKLRKDLEPQGNLPWLVGECDFVPRHQPTPLQLQLLIIARWFTV